MFKVSTGGVGYAEICDDTQVIKIKSFRLTDYRKLPH